MTTVASAILFRSESKSSGFHANERPEDQHWLNLPTTFFK